MRRTSTLWRMAIAVFLSAIAASAAVPAENPPSYSAQSIVHAATQTVAALAPNTIATIYGKNLSFTTRAVSPADVSYGTLPTSLDGVQVLVSGIPANLFYISPTQINFLIPYEYTSGTVNVVVIRQSLGGPTVKIQLNTASPGLFPWAGNFAIATHLNGSLVAADSPAKPGEIVVMYAAGLGKTNPETSSGRIVSAAAVLAAPSQFKVLLDGEALPASLVLYAGLAPGFAGLYQVNLRLPALLPHDPEIRLAMGNLLSPPLIYLATEPTAGQ